MEPDIENEDLLIQLNSLFEAGLYRQVISEGEAALGPFREWQGLSLRLLGSRCLGHLGLRRTAAASFISISRQYPTSSFAWHFRLEAIRELRGPAIAWNAYLNLPSFKRVNSESQALLKTSGAFILAEFKDYVRANELMLEARALAILPWNTVEYAFLRAKQGDLDMAWDLINGCLKVYPAYLPALTLSAQLYAHERRYQDAVNVLGSVLATQESIPANEMLFSYHLKLGNFASARSVLDRIKSLAIERQAESSHLVDSLELDLWCASGNFQAAVPLLSRRVSHDLSELTGLKSSLSGRARYVTGAEQSSAVASVEKADGLSAFQKILEVPSSAVWYKNPNHFVWDVLGSWWGLPLDIDWSTLQEHSTGLTVVRQQAIEQGWHVVEFEFRSGTAETLLDRDCPFLIELPDVERFQHVLVVGYDRKHKVCYLRTPGRHRLAAVSMQDLLLHYAASGPRCFVLVPDAKKECLNGIHFESDALFKNLFEEKVALASLDFDKANRFLRKLESLAGDHRITLIGRAELARAQHDERKRLEVALTLLDRYPNDSRLLVEIIHLMESLGEVQRLDNYLIQLADTTHVPGFEVRTRMAAVLGRDSRQASVVKRLYGQLLRERPFHAYTLHHYGLWLFEQKEWARAHDFLRFSTLQDEVLESYVASYFRSAVFNKLSERALDFVKTRYERFKHRTSAPAKTLYLAYEMLDQVDQGLAVLAEAFAGNPADVVLGQFYFEQLLRSGQLTLASSVVDAMESFNSPVAQLALRAHLAEAEQNISYALECWQKLLTHEQLHRLAHESIVRLMVGQGDAVGAVDHLNDRLLRYPGNYWFLRWRIEYVNESEVEFIESALHDLLSDWPEDIWALLALANLMLQQRRWSEAEEALEKASQIDPDDPDIAFGFGCLFFEMTALEEAKNWFLEAIDRSIDCFKAYQPLLNCVNSMQEKRDLMQRIHALLIERRTTGEGLLHYHRLAMRYLPAQEVRTFIAIAVVERPDLWQSWWVNVAQHIQEGQLDKAYEFSVKGIKKIPLSKDLWFQRAEVERLSHKLKRAVVSLRKCMTIAPEWSEPAIVLAQLLRQMHKAPESQWVLVSAARRNPKDAGILCALAEFYWQNKQMDAALKTIDQAVTVDVDHAWSWKRYATWAKSIGAPALPLQKHERLLNQSPGNEALYPLIISLTDDPDKRLRVLQHGLTILPRSLVIHQALLKELVNQGKPDEALRLSQSEAWRGNIPVEISSYGAWIKYKVGRKQAALTDLKNLLELDPNYQDGWRLLSLWCGELGLSAEAIDAARRSLALAPNDPDALCFLAEALKNQSENPADFQSEVKALLARAFYLRPFDHYNALAFIDLLLEARELAEAEDAFNLLKVNARDVFVRVRELQLSCLKRDLTAALNHWDAVLLDTESNISVMHYSFNEMLQAGWFEPAVQRILYLMQRGSVNPAAGAVWARYIIHKEGLPGFEQRLTEMGELGALGDFAVGCFLTKLHQSVSPLGFALVHQHRELFIRNVSNSELVLKIFYDQENWRACCEWGQQLIAKRRLSGESLLHISVSALETQQTSVLRQLLEMKPVVPDAVWQGNASILSAWLAFMESRRLPNEELLLKVPADQLEPLTCLLYWYLRALVMVERPGGYPSNSVSIKPLLKNAQRVMPVVYLMTAAQNAKHRVWDYLNQRVGGSAIVKPWRRWSLQSQL